MFGGSRGLGTLRGIRFACRWKDRCRGEKARVVVDVYLESGGCSEISPDAFPMWI